MGALTRQLTPQEYTKRYLSLELSLRDRTLFFSPIFRTERRLQNEKRLNESSAHVDRYLE